MTTIIKTLDAPVFLATRPCVADRDRARAIRTRRRLTLLLAFASLAFTPAHAAETSSANSAQKDPSVTYPQVSEKLCPAEVLSLAGKGGNKIPVVVRKPPGKGPFPAVVLLHGGLLERPVEYLKNQALNSPTHARFLAGGYVTVTPSFRNRKENPQTRDALDDCLTVIDHVRKIPQVDAKSIVVVGGSGGGSLALELAGETDLRAVAAGEPASILFTGMLTATEGDSRSLMEKTMEEPKAFYTPALQRFTREKIARIRCPVFIGHGDKHAINKINHEIIIPELKAAGKQLQVIAYPGQPHGFYFGANGDPAAGKKFFEDADAFFKKYLSVQPKRLAASAITLVSSARKEMSADDDPSARDKRKK